MDNGFLLPGVFEALTQSDEASLHQGGLDSLTIRTDDADTWGNDPTIAGDDAQQWTREQLPQFGPAFVPFVAAEFNKLHALADAALAKWSYESVTVVAIASVQTDASGNVGRGVQGNAILYEPPPGFSFALHRLMIRDEAHTLGSPYTAAGSWWEGRVNDEMIVGNSMVSGQGQLPTFGTWGTRDAPRIRDGEVLSLFMSGGPVNTKLTIRMQGTLDRTAEG